MSPQYAPGILFHFASVRPGPMLLQRKEIIKAPPPSGRPLDCRLLETHLDRIKEGEHVGRPGEDADLADCLEVVRKEDEDKFFAYLRGLPMALQAQTIIELPGPFQVDLIRKLEAAELGEILTVLETDDATDLMQLILKVDADKGEGLFELLGDELQRIIRQLLAYSEEQAGSLMQTEVFSAHLDETIQVSLNRLKRLKARGRLEGVQHVYVLDEHGRLIGIIPFAELILISSRKRYAEVVENYAAAYTIAADGPLEEAVRMMEKYDLAILPVVDRFGHLLGRITHDDLVDVIQEMATGQMYALGKVSAEEELHEGAAKTGRSRAVWLAINLVNATLVSVVIGFFEHALETVVALAVLMPIVANMAGTASVQTLTVIIRQMALGELTAANASVIFFKEFNISAVNGLLFGVLAMGISYVWFGSATIGWVMFLSMLVSFISAGVIGAGVPVAVKRFGIDPAVASSVIVITLVDVIGFFSFLLFASWWVL
jgi:magnesium transporter